MLTIGFANKYYTLWNVDEPQKVFVNRFEYYITQQCTYLQNLSTDMEKAKQKVSRMSEPYAIDMELRGCSSFLRRSDIMTNLEPWQFSYGQLQGEDIRTCDNVWQLNRALEGERGKRRRVYARRRLIELGILVPYKHTYYYSWSTGGEDRPSSYIYATRLAEIKEKERKEKMQGHFFKNGERIEIEVKAVDMFWFDTQYGSSCVLTMVDRNESRMFKYVGASPPGIRDEEDNHIPLTSAGWFKINATIEHSNYRGVDETRLKRIKIIATSLCE